MRVLIRNMRHALLVSSLVAPVRNHFKFNLCQFTISFWRFNKTESFEGAYTRIGSKWMNERAGVGDGGSGFIASLLSREYRRTSRENRRKLCHWPSVISPSLPISPSLSSSFTTLLAFLGRQLSRSLFHFPFCVATHSARPPCIYRSFSISWASVSKHYQLADKAVW